MILESQSCPGLAFYICWGMSLGSEKATFPKGMWLLAPPARLELTTLRLGGARSIQVSYGGLLPVYSTQESLCCQGWA